MNGTEGGGALIMTRMGAKQREHGSGREHTEPVGDQGDGSRSDNVLPWLSR